MVGTIIQASAIIVVRIKKKIFGILVLKIDSDGSFYKIKYLE